MNAILSENLVVEKALESYHLANVTFEGLRKKFCWPMFEMGQIVVSEQAACELTVADLENAMHQHGSGSWGKLGSSEWRQNDFRLDARQSVTSVYEAKKGTMFMVHTDFDRQITEVLLPREM